jgi:hypothetical protein
MKEVEAQSRDGLWVLLKLEHLAGQQVWAEPESAEPMQSGTLEVTLRLTVRADDKIDPSRLISLFRTEIERARGVVPAAMQPFYVYGIVVFEWHETRSSEDGLLLSSLKELVAKSDLKRSTQAPR